MEVSTAMMMKNKYVKEEKASAKGLDESSPADVQKAELDVVRDGPAETQRTRRRLLREDLEKECRMQRELLVQRPELGKSHGFEREGEQGEN